MTDTFARSADSDFPHGFPEASQRVSLDRAVVIDGNKPFPLRMQFPSPVFIWPVIMVSCATHAGLAVHPRLPSRATPPPGVYGGKHSYFSPKTGSCPMQRNCPLNTTGVTSLRSRRTRRCRLSEPRRRASALDFPRPAAPCRYLTRLSPTCRWGVHVALVQRFRSR